MKKPWRTGVPFPNDIVFDLPGVGGAEYRRGYRDGLEAALAEVEDIIFHQRSYRRLHKDCSLCDAMSR